MSVSKLRTFEHRRQVRYQTQRSSGSRPYFSLASLRARSTAFGSSPQGAGTSRVYAIPPGRSTSFAPSGALSTSSKIGRRNLPEPMSNMASSGTTAPAFAAFFRNSSREESKPTGTPSTAEVFVFTKAMSDQSFSTASQSSASRRGQPQSTGAAGASSGTSSFPTGMPFSSRGIRRGSVMPRGYRMRRLTGGSGPRSLHHGCPEWRKCQFAGLQGAFERAIGRENDGAAARQIDLAWGRPGVDRDGDGRFAGERPRPCEHI